MPDAADLSDLGQFEFRIVTPDVLHRENTIFPHIPGISATFPRQEEIECGFVQRYL